MMIMGLSGVNFPDETNPLKHHLGSVNTAPVDGLQCGAPVYEIAKLVNISPISMVYYTYNYS